MVELIVAYAVTAVVAPLVPIVSGAVKDMKRRRRERKKVPSKPNKRVQESLRAAAEIMTASSRSSSYSSTSPYFQESFDLPPLPLPSAAEEDYGVTEPPAVKKKLRYVLQRFSALSPLPPTFLSFLLLSACVASLVTLVALRSAFTYIARIYQEADGVGTQVDYVEGEGKKIDARRERV